MAAAPAAGIKLVMRKPIPRLAIFFIIVGDLFA